MFEPVSFCFPVFKHVVKKNRRPIFNAGGRTFIGKSKELRDAERMFQILFANYQGLAIDKPCHVKLTFIFGPDQNRSFAMTDLSNLIELPMDCMQPKILANDRLCCSFDGTRKVKGPKTMLKIEIFPYNEI